MGKILIVDDEPDVLRIMDKALSKVGHEVITLDNGQKCLDYLRGGKELPDLILLDVMMPGMNGWDVCKEIKSDSKISSIYVIMLTVRSQRIDMEKSINVCGADGHFNKPVTIKTLRTTVDNFLSKDTPPSKLWVKSDLE